MPRIAGLLPMTAFTSRGMCACAWPENGHRTGTIGARERPYRGTSRLELPDLNGAGRGGRTLTSLRSKVFEFSLGQAPTVTIGHDWSIFRNLDASTSSSL